MSCSRLPHYPRDEKSKRVDRSHRRRGKRKTTISRGPCIVHVRVRPSPSLKPSCDSLKHPSNHSSSKNPGQSDTDHKPNDFDRSGDYDYTKATGHETINQISAYSYQPNSLRETKESWATTMDYSKRDRRNPKETFKCSRWIILIIAAAVLLLSIALAILLVLLLVKPKEKTSSEKTVVLRWNTTGITIAGTTGSSGTGNNQLSSPWGLVVTDDYSLYVADRFNHRIQKYVRGSSVGSTVAGSANGTAGGGNSSLFSPTALILDTNQNMYIADANNFRVQFWPSGASTAVTVAGHGGPGIGPNQLLLAYGLTKDWNNDVLYVVDCDNARVMSYASGANSGTLAFGGNGNGTNTNQLKFPLAIHFDAPSNSYLIVNRDNHNVVRWKLGEPTWTIVAGSPLGIAGNTPTTLNTPPGLTVDPMGNIYVADAFNHRIQFFAPNQLNGVTIIGETGQGGNSSELLNWPFAVALDNQLNLYVVDCGNHRIQKYNRY